MTFASVGTLGTGTDNTNDTSLVLTTSAQLDSGNLGVLWISFDNRGSTDGNNGEISSVVDSASNTWVEAHEYTNGQGSAGAGVTGAIYITRATANLALGGTITVTLRQAVTAKTCSAWEFTLTGNGYTVLSVTQAVGDAADPAAISLSGLANQEYLWLHLFGVEHPADTYTQDADYSSISAANIGAGAAGNSVYGGFRIYTGTTDEVDVAFATAADHVQLLVAVVETVAGGVEILGELNRGTVIYTVPLIAGLAGWTQTNGYFEMGNVNTHPPSTPHADVGSTSFRMKYDNGLVSKGNFPAGASDTAYIDNAQAAGEYVYEYWEVEHDDGIRTTRILSNSVEVANWPGPEAVFGETLWSGPHTHPFKHTSGNIRIEINYTAPALTEESGIKDAGLRIRTRYALGAITLTASGTVVTPPTPYPAETTLDIYVRDQVELEVRTI